MPKRNPDELKLISANIFTNSDESLMSIAILNALEILNAKNNPLVKIPTRKELTKLLKNTQFDNFCKVFDELNHVRIRKVPCIEATGEVGMISLNHPIKGLVHCLVYRDKTIGEYDYKLINSGLGNDEIIIDVDKFNDKLEYEGGSYYQIFLDTGTKEIVEHKEFSCNECCHYAIEKSRDICLYDNTELVDTNHCCNKYLNCFKWNTINN